MPGNAQVYIDALRNGDYNKAAQLVAFVNNKYSKISGKTNLSQDSILPLVIYELCQTDLTTEDLKGLLFIREYLQFNNIAQGKLAYSIFTLSQAFSQALELKQEDSFKEMIDSIEIEDKIDIDELLNEGSEFSKLETKISRYEKRPLLDMMNNQLDEGALTRIIDQMDNKTFLQFIESRKSLIKEIEQDTTQQLDFKCPMINKRIIKNDLVNNINLYKQHLEQKLYKKEGIDIAPNSVVNYTASEDNNSKLLQRYQAINKIDLTNFDITDKVQIEDLSSALDQCKSLKPSWKERELIQKITDVLSFGIKPLIRALTSKQTKLETEIEKTISSLKS